MEENQFKIEIIEIPDSPLPQEFKLEESEQELGINWKEKLKTSCTVSEGMFLKTKETDTKEQRKGRLDQTFVQRTVSVESLSTCPWVYSTHSMNTCTNSF